MRVAVAQELTGIESVTVEELPPPPDPGPGQVLIRVHCAGVGPWDVGMLGGGFPGTTVPFVPSQEVSGVVEAVGAGAEVQPGQRVYATTFPTGGGLAEFALADSGRVAAMPADTDFAAAAGLVIAAGTAHEGLIDRGRLRAGESVLITAASGGVGSCAVQIAVAVGARVLGVASLGNHGYLRSLGAAAVFDYHDPDWAGQVRRAVPGGIDLLFDGAGGQTRDSALTTIRDNGRAVSIIAQDPMGELERGITGDTFAARVDRQRLDALTALVESGKLHPTVEAVFPLEQAPEALARVAGGHTRGKLAVRLVP
ncbi:NADPH:quinone reductase-like Zn-dependent oxidoreductase [Nocardia tenerifensis]|uniref:NADPH:quinone reductase-like Zn-dependent oxidoreductase n=1 Tax=Nocardia tenerifensis TaxID=228006 RepID=A0A318JQ68_9NOCA|nr:NADP-dependent oxidoreductase [Nocardia tenerifensis]PXX55626.1 NADPH:quinone reductase-like Zn-dependent oxidoreductase [Nocardia tenerifensis]